MKIQIIVSAFLVYCTGHLVAADEEQYQIDIIHLGEVKGIFEASVAGVNLMGLSTKKDMQQAYSINAPYLDNVFQRLSKPGYVVVAFKKDDKIYTESMCTKQLTKVVFTMWHNSYKNSYLYQQDASTAAQLFPEVYDRLAIAMASHGLMQEPQ